MIAQGCKKGEEPENKGLNFSDEKSQLEEQNLKALCAAAAEVAAVEGVQDRMSRIAEIAVLTSPTTDMVDGLTAMEGHERLPMLKKLVAKYSFEEGCKKGLQMFDRGLPRSAAVPPKLPEGSKDGAKPEGGDAAKDPEAEAGEGSPTTEGDGNQSGEEGGEGWWDLPGLFGPEDQEHQGP